MSTLLNPAIDLLSGSASEGEIESPWRYGNIALNDLVGTLNPLPAYKDQFFKGYSGGDDGGTVVVNTNTSPIRHYTGILEPRTLVLHPSRWGARAVVRFIAPEDDTYAINGYLQDLNVGCGYGALFLINKNISEEVYRKGWGPSDSERYSFSQSINLLKGEMLDFALDWGEVAEFACDSTAFALSISPETQSNDIDDEEFFGDAAVDLVAAVDGNIGIDYPWQHGSIVPSDASGTINAWAMVSDANFKGFAGDYTGAVVFASANQNTFDWYTGKVEPNTLVLHPSITGERATIRFTVPETGEYTFNGYCQDIDTNGGDGASFLVTKNLSNEMLRLQWGANDSNKYDFSQTVSLSEGDILDFAVDMNGDYSYDSTLLKLTVQSGVPNDDISESTEETNDGTTNNAPTIKIGLTDPSRLKVGSMRLDNLVDELFLIDDQEDDPIISYRLSVRQSKGDHGYIISRQSGERLPNNASLQDYSLSQLAAYRYYPGGLDSSQTFKLAVSDGTSWSKPLSYKWKVESSLQSNSKPVLSFSDATSSAAFAGKTLDASNWIAASDSDPQDKILRFVIRDQNDDPSSGRFVLGAGRSSRLMPEGKESSFVVTSHELAELKWQAGQPGTSDSISISVKDPQGLTSDEVTRVWSTNRTNNVYAAHSSSGFYHVSEGGEISFDIRKLNNTNLSTSIQYFISDDNGGYALDDVGSSAASEWKTLSFKPGDDSKIITVQTLADSIDEGSEKLALWIYNEQLDNNRQPFQDGLNPAYSKYSFSVHDKPTFVMGPSQVKVEGEASEVLVARFGGGDAPSNVRVRTQVLGGTGSETNGFATTGDFGLYDKVINFSADSDSGTGSSVLPFVASSDLLKDNSSNEPEEVFAWVLSNKDKKSEEIIDYRLTTILDEKPSKNEIRQYGLLSTKSPGFFDKALSGIFSFFQKATTNFGSVLSNLEPKKSSSSIPKTLQKTKSGGFMGLSKGGLVVSPQASLIGQDGSTLIAAGGMNLIAAGGMNLIAAGGMNFTGKNDSRLIGMDGATLIGMDGATLIGMDGATLIGMDGATLISNKGFAALRNV